MDIREEKAPENTARISGARIAAIFHQTATAATALVFMAAGTFVLQLFVRRGLESGNPLDWALASGGVFAIGFGAYAAIRIIRPRARTQTDTAVDERAAQQSK